MHRTLYASLGLALMLLIAFAPLFVRSGGTAVVGAPAAARDTASTASAVDRAVEDLAAWPVAATR